MNLTAKEYGYRGNEIAEFIRKDPALVTRHLQEKDKVKKEIETVVEKLWGKG